MEKVTIRLKIITPLFCGGAEPNGPAELRVPSLKGAIRYWYRAVDSTYCHPVKEGGPTWEEHIFGSAGHGTGLFRLSVSGPRTGAWRWRDQRHRYDQAFTINRRQPDVKNGILYLGYSHDLGFGKPDGNDRRAIPAGQTITVVMRFFCKPQARDRRAIAAAWWFLGHVGGLGSRSRRGFGTVALHSWTTAGEAWEELTQLPIAHVATTPTDWLAKFEGGLKTLHSWYGQNQSADHLVLGPHTRFYLIDDGFQDGELNKQRVSTWECALNRAGRLMQDFRQRYGITKGGDYDLVRAHLCAEHPMAPGCRGKGAPLVKLPDRAAFGLPLAFRFGSLRYSFTGRDGRRRDKTPELTLQGTDHDRSASPIHVRIIQVGSKCYPFFARFDAPLLADGEQVSIRQPHSLPQPVGLGSQRILDDFCQQVLEKVAMKPVVAWR